MLEELKKDVFISQELRYFDLTNIFFDAPLNYGDISNLKEIFFSINNITQIYFRKNVDLKTIEIVKYLLELSPTMEDSRIEKYILDAAKVDLKELSDMNFYNPTNWYVKTNFDNSKIMSVDKYREIENIITSILKDINKDNYSTFEKVALMYDWCKNLRLKNIENEDVLQILKNKECNIKGYSKIFKILLNRVGLNSYIGESLVDNESSNVVIAPIKDDKYNIDGIYLFDPFSDYISKEDVPDELLRLLNYNYFGILLKDYSKTVFGDKLTGILNCFTHDYEYDAEKIRFISNKKLKEIEECFNMSFVSLHEKIENTLDIKDEMKLEVICAVNNENLHSLIKENYKSRKNKLLNYGI